MTENKRFIPIFDEIGKRVVGARDNGENISFMDMFDLLNKQDKIITDNERLNKAKNQQLEDAKQILKSEMKYVCKQKRKYLNDSYIYQAYNIIEYGLIKTLEELGWDSE